MFDIIPFNFGLVSIMHVWDACIHRCFVYPIIQTVHGLLLDLRHIGRSIFNGNTRIQLKKDTLFPFWSLAYFHCYISRHMVTICICMQCSDRRKTLWFGYARIYRTNLFSDHKYKKKIGIDIFRIMIGRLEWQRDIMPWMR